jgi:hypothetical protein
VAIQETGRPKERRGPQPACAVGGRQDGESAGGQEPLPAAVQAGLGQHSRQPGCLSGHPGPALHRELALVEAGHTHVGPLS